jgi:preprotein translocase subunit SecB
LDQALSPTNQTVTGKKILEHPQEKTMAENETAAAPEAAQAQPQMRILGQFIRDMSFENIMAQKGAPSDAQPDVQVQVNLDAKKRGGDNQFESAIKLNVTSKDKESGTTLFVMEIDYVGIFHVEGVPEDQMHPFLLIECPRMIFPFLRRIVSDVTRDGGFPPLNLENIDFIALYRNEIARRQAEAPAEPAPSNA